MSKEAKELSKLDQLKLEIEKIRAHQMQFVEQFIKEQDEIAKKREVPVPLCELWMVYENNGNAYNDDVYVVKGNEEQVKKYCQSVQGCLRRAKKLTICVDLTI